MVDDLLEACRMAVFLEVAFPEAHAFLAGHRTEAVHACQVQHQTVGARNQAAGHQAAFREVVHRRAVSREHLFLHQMVAADNRREAFQSQVAACLVAFQMAAQIWDRKVDGQRMDPRKEIFQTAVWARHVGEHLQVHLLAAAA